MTHRQRAALIEASSNAALRLPIGFGVSFAVNTGDLGGGDDGAFVSAAGMAGYVIRIKFKRASNARARGCVYHAPKENIEYWICPQ